MSEITITLPDGSQQKVAAGSTPLDVARNIGPRLADDAVVAKVNGELADLTRPFSTDSTLQILTTKDSESLHVYRHSTAHLLAAAVLELYPETKLGIGPPTDTGFFYDFYRDDAVHAGGPREDRGQNGGAGEAGPALRAQDDAQARGPEEIRRDGRRAEVRADHGEGRRDLLRIHARARISSISAAARTCPRAGRSRRSSCSPSPAPIGRATSTTGKASASTARPSSARRSSTITCTSSKKRRSATTASWARSWTCSAFRSWPGRG